MQSPHLAESSTSFGTPAPQTAGWGWRWGSGIFALLLVLRVIYAAHFRFDTDEPQHLHVVWGWANGHLQYKEIFDNHGPTFHCLFAPLFRALGERPDILIPMRLAMIPFFAVCLWCVAKIGETVFSREAGIWAALLCGFYPEYFLTSTEFRTDDLWVTLWLLALVVAFRPPITVRRVFVIGLLLGAAFSVTVKTGLMIGSLGLTVAVMTGSNWLGGTKPDWTFLFKCGLAGLAGLVIVPGAAVSFFAAHGALREFLYCNISHNLVPRTQNWERIGAHMLWFPLFVAIVLGILGIAGRRTFEGTPARRWALVLIAGFYFTALKTFFPTLSRQDDLPVIPLVCLVLAGGFFQVRNQLASQAGWRSLIAKRLPPALVAAELITLIVSVPPWRDSTRRDVSVVADVLRATTPDEFVMDATGETIFRMRPFYYALEAFTKARMERGWIKDEINERLITTATSVVLDNGLTERARYFVRRNYVKIAHDLFMLGQMLEPSAEAGAGTMVFEIAIPERYEIVAPRGKGANGILDGTPLDGPRMLQAGRHTYTRTDKQTGRLCVFWAKGLERGFSPFKRREMPTGKK